MNTKVVFEKTTEDIEQLKKELYELRMDYGELRRKYEDLKKRYIRQNNELLEYMKGEVYEDNIRKSEERTSRY